MSPRLISAGQQILNCDQDRRPNRRFVSGMASEPLFFLGGDSQGGSYVLRIFVDRPITIRFGGFKRGKLIAVPAGDHSYVGTALGQTGAVCLARRLVRHATRCSKKSPHRIRELMQTEFPRIGLGCGDLLPVNGKKLHWNVDHLLDQPFAHLMAAYVIRCPCRMERELGQLIEKDPAAAIYQRGLGTNDVPGNTHLLKIDADNDWWVDLPRKLEQLVSATLAREQRGSHETKAGPLARW
jgi:Uri superfamily endonuclease